jgi:hypothetical protein
MQLRVCLPKAASPGTLRWSALLFKTEITFSEHQFEPIGNGAEPTSDEFACLVRTLDSVDLKALRVPPGFETQRISLILEF